MAKTILVIDDEREYRALLSRILEAAGYEVVEAGTGAAGLKAYAEKAPDLLMVDVMLPDMLGYDFCKKLRDQGAQEPILLCTVRSAVTSLAHGVKSGSTDYVLKPFAPQDLLRRVRAALREE
jgi:two-component system response regulator MprA